MNRKKNKTINQPPRKKQIGSLTERENRMLRSQIRKNSIAIDHYILTIDLLINKEQCPPDANTLLRLRKQLEIAISENDTFRKVLWQHLKMVEQATVQFDDGLDAVSFLADRIKTRKFALIAQSAMK